MRFLRVLVIMHLSLLLFLLLNFLICAVDSDVKLDQKMLMTKPATKLAKIECIFPRDCYFYLYWYQKKENEAFKMVQYVKINDGTNYNEPGFEFLKTEKTEKDKFVLIIPNLKIEHSATYYCVCWLWEQGASSQ